MKNITFIEVIIIVVVIWVLALIIYLRNNPPQIPKPTPMDCIREYTEWLDEKYNNPDNVSNLREDDYSQVVRTCNEIFWEKVIPNKK